MRNAVAGSSRASGRASIAELALWDAGLLMLVCALAVLDFAVLPAQEEATASPSPAASPSPVESPAASPEPSAPAPSPSRRGPRRVDATPDEPPGGLDEDALEVAVTGLARQAKARLADGRLGEVLAVFDAAPEDVRGTRAWDDAREEIAHALLLRDAVAGALPEAGARADLGDVAGVRALIAALPAGADRPPLEAELERARERARASASGGFELEGFRPGWREVEGERCVLGSSLEGDAPAAAAAAVDDVLTLTEQLLELAPEGPLAVVVLDPDDAAPRQGVYTWRRPDEPDARAVARTRAAVALWVAGQAGLDGPPWWRLGLTRVLAGAAPRPGAGPRLTPTAACWRRQLAYHSPRREGAALVELVAAERPDPVRAWALASFACFAPEPGARALQGARAVEPAAAAALEAAWVDYVLEGR